MTRSQRERRAQLSILVGGGSAALAVVFLVLAVVGVTGIGPAFLFAVIAAIAWLLLRGVLRR